MDVRWFPVHWESPYRRMDLSYNHDSLVGPDREIVGHVTVFEYPTTGTIVVHILFY